MAALDQRYTASRRALVDALLEADRPLTIPEILAGAKGMPQSSAYRNLTVLCEAGVARRLPGVDEFGRFELAEDLAGHHHHLHVRVVRHGRSTSPPRPAGAGAGRGGPPVAAETGFEITGHRLDFDGRCPRCR